MLNRNPFFLLGVSIRDTKELITEAFENKISDGEFEEDFILEARKTLMISKARLTAEVSWFINIPPKKEKQICDLLKQDNIENNINHYKDILKELDGISKCNLAAYVCQQNAGDYEFLQALTETQSEVKIEEIQTFINENRKVSGFPEISKDLVNDQLNKQKKLWVDAAIHQISQVDHPANFMTNLLREFLDSNIASKRFLEELAERYDTLIIPTLRNHEDAINSLISKAQGSNGAEPSPLIEKIIEELKLWGEYARPSQIIFGVKGLDEPRSKKVFDTIREFCLWLANEANQYKLSLNLSKASKEIFKELPAVSNKIDEDVEALDDLVNEEQANKEVSTLLNIVNEIMKDEKPFIKDIKKRALTNNPIGVAQQLITAFHEACKNVEGADYAPYPWQIMRKLAIFLHNEKDNPEAANAIVNFLKNLHPPEALMHDIELDVNIMEGNFLWNDFSKAMKYKRIWKAEKILTKLISISQNEEEKQQCQELLNKLKEQNKERLKNWIFWGFIILVVGWANFSKDEKSNNDTVEIAPPLNNGGTLSLSQLRWCIYQHKRLEHIKNQFKSFSNQTSTTDEHNAELITPEIINNYKALIDDATSRCSDAHYRNSSLNKINKELENDTAIARIASEANNIMKQWDDNFIFKDE